MTLVLQLLGSTWCKIEEDPGLQKCNITIISEEPKALCGSAGLYLQGSSGSALAALLEFISLPVTATAQQKGGGNRICTVLCEVQWRPWGKSQVLP